LDGVRKPTSASFGESGVAVAWSKGRAGASAGEEVFGGRDVRAAFKGRNS
jgi:hypothetical protein